MNETKELSPALSRRVKQHVTGPLHDFRVICHPGFEKTAIRELASLGILNVKEDYGAVEFNGKLTDAWKVNAFARTVTRVWMRVAHFKAENFGRFEKEVADISWKLYLPSERALPEITAVCHKSRLYHTDALIERAATVIGGKLHAVSQGTRAGAAADSGLLGKEPPQSVLFRFDNDVCEASVDLTGEALYKRGYDKFTERAPLRDTMAAAILYESGILTAQTLEDPMSGSGTFSLEAALWASGKTPAMTRKTESGAGFALATQPAFKAAAWNFIATKTEVPKPGSALKIHAGDKDPEAMETVAHNIKAAQMEKYIEADTADFFEHAPAGENSRTLLVLNPPYGKRLPVDAPRLYAEIGKKIAKDFKHANVAVIVPDAICGKALRLHAQNVIRTDHGGMTVTVEIKTAQ